MSKHDELISIVIPCYNAEKCVGEAIESALNQTYEPTEIIVIDDGSTDESLSVIRSFDEQVIWRTGENKGACHARNVGLALAQGEYVQFLDADDLLLPKKIEHQMQIIRNYETLPDLIAADYEKEALHESTHVVEVEETDDWISLINKNLGITSSNLWRRSFLKKVGGWNENMPSSQEAELMFRMLQAGADVTYDHTCLTLVRQQRKSIGTNEGGDWRPENRERYFRLRGEIIRYLYENELLTAERKEIGLHDIFRQLRILYEYDADLASHLHRHIIPNDFCPKQGFNTRPFIYCYKLFGFKWAERIKRVVRS
jgi:glycosyltransferase involved in cell wall biosynthesis